ncbi:MAG: phospholipase D-like domain-containing protein [Campylobacterota bacterium]|nr:phospholipase D-like domain-containing protein [Campylobacterota bacterium]
MIAEIDWIVYYAFILTGQLFFVAALLHLIYQRHSPTSMIAWFLAIFLLPYVAVPFYFILGLRKHRKKIYKSAFSMQAVNELPPAKTAPIDTLLRSNGIPGTTTGNRFALYTDGVSAYHLLLEAIENAKESIFISTYIFKNDAIGKTVLAALTEKAKMGVQVKVLIDSLGSYRLYFFQYSLRALREAGGEVLFFMPVMHTPFRNYINLRNHRKIYLFDQRTVLTGGMNISCEYMGPSSEKVRWNDLLFLAEGPAVFHYCEIFISDWLYAAQSSDFPKSKLLPDPLGTISMQVVPSGPDVDSDALFEALTSAIHDAKTRIWLVTPYFVPDASLIQALIIAKHKGVDVRLITPRESDHLIADIGRSSFMRELTEAGIDVALYEGSMLHAKAVLFDNTIAMLGSVNVDNRSLFLNYEVVSFSYSEPVINAVEQWMQKLIEHSGTKMEPAGRVRKLGENFMRVIAPIL